MRVIGHVVIQRMMMIMIVTKIMTLIFIIQVTALVVIIKMTVLTVKGSNKNNIIIYILHSKT